MEFLFQKKDFSSKIFGRGLSSKKKLGKDLYIYYQARCIIYIYITIFWVETISLQIVFFGKHFFFKTLSVFFSLERVFLVGILSSIHLDKKSLSDSFV